MTSQYSRGGGVLIAVKAHLNCEVIPILNCDHLEQVAVRVRLKRHSLYFVAIYLPPNSHTDLYSAHSNAVQQVANGASAADIIVSLGDFNLPNLRWQLDEDVNGYVPLNVSTEQEQALIETMFASGLQQTNRYVNANGRLLDLVFVSLPERLDIIEPSMPLLPVDIHHAPFILLFDESIDDVSVQNEVDDNVFYDFHSCDFNVLKVALAAVDWDIVLQNGSLDEILSAFYDKLYAVLNDYVPLKRRTFSSVTSKPWWTSELRHLRNILRKARHRFFTSKLEGDRVYLREVETQYKAALASTYNNYLSRIQANVRHNPLCFWDFVKKRQAANRIPTNVSFNNIQVHTNGDAADLFATFFESVFSKVSPVSRRDCFAHILPENINLPAIQFTTDEVVNAIDILDIKKGSGTDGIPPLLLRNCCKELAKPIVCLFNRSLREKTFPMAWKAAYIVPIHKSGNCNQVTNYRGVSILCSLSKVFERLVHTALYSVASTLIFDGQHGFMKHRSTTTNLMCYVTSLSREVEERRQVDAVYVDFAKAFDTVPHILIVNKLKHIGFPDWITEWIHSYLCERTAFVVVNSARSRTFNITSGVPQGSVLGPLLFNIFINDLCLLLSSSKLSFADDLKLYRVISSPMDCSALQDDINILLVWCGDNGMQVNNNKCKAISFSRRSNLMLHEYKMDITPLDRVSSICDLGVTIDTKLRFNEHVSIISAKAFSVLGFIRRHASEFTDIYALKTLYCSLVRSTLEYAAPIWFPHYTAHCLAIERVQKKFLRFALRHLPWNDPINLPPYLDRCKLIGLEALSDRRIRIQRLFIYDVIGGIIDCPELLAQIPLNIPPRRFRNSPLIAVPYHRTNYGYNNPFDSCLRSFNMVSDEFDFNLTKNAFRNRISSNI